MADTKLNADLVLRKSFDAATDRLNVNANVSGITVDLNSASDNVAIKNSAGTNELKINSNGSIDANIIVDSSSGDNIAISDGTHTLAVNADGSINVNGFSPVTGFATETTLKDGNQTTTITGVAKGSTTAAKVTSTNQSVDRQALDVQIRTSSGVAVDTFGGGTQYADGVVRGTATGTLAMGDDGTNIQSIKVNSSGELQVGIVGAVPVTDNGGSLTVDGVFWQATQPISAASLPLPTGAATESTLSTLNTKIPSLGQATMANSEPVTIASNQSTIPTQNQDNIASGNITTQNLVPAGTATANSAVEITLNGANTLSVQTTGTYTGALSLQATVGATNTWVTITGNVFYNINTLGVAATITSATQGIFRVDVAGYSKVRVTGLSAMTGTVTVTLNAGIGTGYVSLQNPIPAGTNAIGSVTIGSGTVSSITSSQSAIPGSIADVTSAALTTTTTTATITPTFGVTYKVSIPVTVVSGTNPTLDVSIEESADSGTNWFKVYDFPRITATGYYQSPTIPLTGNRVRYVQTVGGTTPSFTRSINRLQSSWASADRVRQLINRTINLTTLNSTTPLLYVDGTTTAQIVINIGTATTPPAIQLEGSEDGTNFYNLGSPLTAVASSTVKLSVTDSAAKFIRGRVSTIGNTVVAGYISIKAF